MAFKAQNTISGKEGRLFLEGEELAFIKTFEANVEKNKSEVNVMGRRMTGHKTTGANGTGTATFYKVTSRFVQLMLNYVKKEKIHISLFKLSLTINHQAVALSVSHYLMSTLILLKSLDWMLIQRRLKKKFLSPSRTLICLKS